jgi:predicted transcriptional regulator
MITETPEEREEFNRVERESKAKQESIRGTKHPTREQLMEELSVAQMLIRELGDRLAKLEKPWVGLTRDEQSFVYSNLHNATSREDSFWVDFANAIEQALKERNA